MINELAISTSTREQLLDITNELSPLIKGVSEGIMTVFVPHTTAAITINENADPDVKTDMIWKLNHLSPIHKEYRHYEGNSDAHVKASLLGQSVQIIIKDGNLLLGTWQGIYFAEFDGPRTRKVFVKY